MRMRNPLPLRFLLRYSSALALFLSWPLRAQGLFTGKDPWRSAELFATAGGVVLLVLALVLLVSVLVWQGAAYLKRLSRAQAKAEADLRASNERFELAMRGSGVGLWDWDIRTGKVYYSPRWKALFGYGENEIGENFEAWATLLHPDEKDRICKFQEDFLAGTDQTVTAEYRLRHKDGSYRWIEASAIVVRDEKGRACRLVGSHGDITARKRAEEALRKSEEQLRTVLENSRDGINMLDLATGRYVFLSPAQVEMSGFTLEELNGITAEEAYARVHPDDRELSIAQHQRVIAGEDPGEPVEYRWKVKSGEYRWFSDRRKVVRDEQGKPVALVGISRDITQRKLGEQLLQEAREQSERDRKRLEAILQATPSAVVIIEAGGRFAYMNQRARELYGVDYSGAGLDVHIVQVQALDTDGSPFPVERLPVNRSLRKGEIVHGVEMTIQRPDGARLPVMVGSAPLYDSAGAVDAAVVVFEDISERKRVEETLRESESRAKVNQAVQRERQRFYDLLNILPAYVILLSPDYHVPFANRFFEERFGKSQGRRCFEYLFNRTQPCDNCETYTVLKTGVPHNWEWLGPDGRNYEIHDFPFTDADGSLMIMETGIDVTARKKAEASLKEANERLEERTAKLQELVGELEHFSYAITHDMRAPLRAMMGFAEVVSEECRECPNEQQKDLLRRIGTSARRMDLLITDALNYSRAVRQELPLAPVEVGPLLRGMLDSYPEFQPSRARIRIEGEIPPVMANEAGLTQCFSNLLGNAVKFTEPGREPQVRIWAERIGQSVRIWVEDNGIGISRIVVPRIFEMFYRGQHALAGTGVGLALVRKVVRGMEGKVGVESEPGKGSRFWLELKSAQFGK